MSDIVIVGAKRTAIGSFLGQFTGVPTPTLGAAAITGALEHAGLAPDQVDEVIMGCVLPAGLGQAPARQASLAAGIPTSAGCTTINKVCGSGMKAIMLGARPDQGRFGQGRRRRRHGVDDQRAAPAQRFAHRHPLRQRRDARPHGLGRPDQSLRRQGHGRVRRCRLREVRLHARRRRMPTPPKACRRAQAAHAVRCVQGRNRSGRRSRAARAKSTVDTDEEPGKIDIAKIPTLRAAFSKDGTMTAASLLEDFRRRRGDRADVRRRSRQARPRSRWRASSPTPPIRRRRSGSPPRR